MPKIIILIMLTICNIGFAKDYVLNGPINDYSNILSEKDKSQLTQSLMDEYKKSGTQVAVLIIDSLDGQSIEEFSIKMVEKYPLGQKGKDNGILFTLVVNDRKVRIEVGRGLEGTLTDLKSKRVLGQAKPYFKSKQFSDGVVIVVNEIVKTIQPDLNEIVEKQEVTEVALTPEQAKQLDLKRIREKEEYDRSVALFWTFAVLFLVLGLGVFFVYSSINTHKAIKKVKADYLFLQESLWQIDQNIPMIDNLFEKRMEYSKKQKTLSEIKSYTDKFSNDESDLINKEKNLKQSINDIDNQIKSLESDPYKKNPLGMLNNLPSGINNRDIEIAKYLK